MARIEVNRSHVLNDLLELNKSIDTIKKELLNFKWDSDEIVVLKKTHLTNLLQLYLSGELTLTEIVEWANVVELREDISYEIPHDETIKSLILELANPDINGELTPHTAKSHLLKLQLG